MKCMALESYEQKLLLQSISINKLMFSINHRHFSLVDKFCLKSQGASFNCHS